MGLKCDRLGFLWSVDENGLYPSPVPNARSRSRETRDGEGQADEQVVMQTSTDDRRGVEELARAGQIEAASEGGTGHRQANSSPVTTPRPEPTTARSVASNSGKERRPDEAERPAIRPALWIAESGRQEQSRQDLPELRRRKRRAGGPAASERSSSACRRAAAARERPAPRRRATPWRTRSRPRRRGNDASRGRRQGSCARSQPPFPDARRAVATPPAARRPPVSSPS